MTIEYAFRAYDRSDFNRLADIHDPARKLELAAAGLGDAFVPFSIAVEEEGLFDYQIIVAENRGVVDAFIAFNSDELAWLYVDPRKQGMGIGFALAEHAMKGLRNGATVEVLTGNRRARRLFERLGFVYQRTMRGSLVGNETFPAAAWILELQRPGQ